MRRTVWIMFVAVTRAAGAVPTSGVIYTPICPLAIVLKRTVVQGSQVSGTQSKVPLIVIVAAPGAHLVFVYPRPVYEFVEDRRTKLPIVWGPRKRVQDYRRVADQQSTSEFTFIRTRSPIGPDPIVERSDLEAYRCRIRLNPISDLPQNIPGFTQDLSHGTLICTVGYASHVYKYLTDLSDAIITNTLYY